MNFKTWRLKLKARKTGEWHDWQNVFASLNEGNQGTDKETSDNLRSKVSTFAQALYVFNQVLPHIGSKIEYFPTLKKYITTANDLIICINTANAMDNKELVYFVLLDLVKVATSTKSWWAVFDYSFEYPEIQNYALDNILVMEHDFEDLVRLIEIDQKTVSDYAEKRLIEEWVKHWQEVRNIVSTVAEFFIMKNRLKIPDTDNEVAERLAGHVITDEDRISLIPELVPGSGTQEALLNYVLQGAETKEKLMKFFDFAPDTSKYKRMAWEQILNEIWTFKEWEVIFEKKFGTIDDRKIIALNMRGQADNLTDLSRALYLKRKLNSGVAIGLQDAEYLEI
jgi:hypothetical protein